MYLRIYRLRIQKSFLETKIFFWTILNEALSFKSIILSVYDWKIHELVAPIFRNEQYSFLLCIHSNLEHDNLLD